MASLICILTQLPKVVQRTTKLNLFRDPWDRKSTKKPCTEHIGAANVHIDVSWMMIVSRMSSLVDSTAPTCIRLRIGLWFDMSSLVGSTAPTCIRLRIGLWFDMSSLVGSTAPTCIPLKIALWFDDTVLSFEFNSRWQSTSVDYGLQVQKADCYCTYNSCW